MCSAAYEKEKCTERPVATLFMLMSLDGKISTGCNDCLDFDRDFPGMEGIKEGLHQYYEIEQTTDLWSLNSGRVQEKMGVNEKDCPEKTVVSFVLIDNSHLNEQGIRYFCGRSKEFVLITSNGNHPAFNVKEDNLHIIYQEKYDFAEAFRILKSDYGCERLTVQTGGSLNSVLLRAGLIDYVDIVIAPALVGGADTSSLIDGKSLSSRDELGLVRALELIEAVRLEDSYLRLKYRVIV